MSDFKITFKKAGSEDLYRGAIMISDTFEKPQPDGSVGERRIAITKVNANDGTLSVCEYRWNSNPINDAIPDTWYKLGQVKKCRHPNFTSFDLARTAMEDILRTCGSEGFELAPYMDVTPGDRHFAFATAVTNGSKPNFA